VEDTIVAAATPWGHGAVAVVRLSGPRTRAILGEVARVPPARRAALATLRDAAGPFDEGLVTWFPGPRSYTGEDSAELSCHGNPLLVERLVEACAAAGARLARPGEFTRRAWMAGRMDLTRAEAVLQLAEATSAVGLELARDAAGGSVARAAQGLREVLVDVAAELEAGVDYPGEGLQFSADDTLRASLVNARAQAVAAAASWPRGRVALEGARVALVGPVNAGKSTLFNTLLGRSRALVSPTPGTTRDVVEAALQLPSARLLLQDTAGDRVADDPIEAAGVALGRAAAAEADLRVLVLPLDRTEDAAAWRARVPAPRVVVGTFRDRGPAEGVDLAVDAREPGEVEAVKAAILAALVGETPGAVGLVVASQRQRDQFREVAAQLDQALDGWEAGPVVVVEALVGAVRAIDALTGRDTREDVLDRLFARFCVGK